MNHRSTGTDRPNVVWISTHDINPHLGAYVGVYPGAEQAVTPHLDRLAAEGARFDFAFATAPVCAPSRSSVMTGCFPTSIGTMHMRSKAVPPATVRLLSEYFRRAGYFTSLSGTTDFQVDVPRSALDECSDDAHWRRRPHPDTPFFAQFHGGITHESQIYVDDGAFESGTADVTADQRHDPSTVDVPPYHPDTPTFRRAWSRYLDLITQMDHWVGGLLRQLDDDGLAENTIVVFWSDHGPGMPRAKRWVTDAGLREPLIIRWPGRIRPNTVRSDLVHLMDLAPTMLEACGLPVPEHMHGISLLDASGTFTEAPNEYVYGGRDRMDEQEDTSRTVRDRRYRYIRHHHPDRSPMQYCAYPDEFDTWRELRRLTKDEAKQRAVGQVPSRLTPLQRALTAAGKPAEELYDLVSDPHEERNLADDDRHVDTLRRFRTALSEWQARFGDLELVTEGDHIEGWRPGGHWRVTEPPLIEEADGVVMARSATEGSSVTWTSDPPSERPSPTAPHWMQDMGAWDDDGRRWHLDCPASPIPREGLVWLRAWRLGYRPSDIVEWRPMASTSATDRK